MQGPKCRSHLKNVGEEGNREIFSTSEQKSICRPIEILQGMGIIFQEIFHNYPFLDGISISRVPGQINLPTKASAKTVKTDIPSFEGEVSQVYKINSF